MPIPYRLAVVGLALSMGCMPFIQRPSNTLDVVARKEAPLTLVATSGRRCATDLVTYAAVKSGTQVECDWQRSMPPSTTATAAVQPPTDMVMPGSKAPPPELSTRSARAKSEMETSSSPWWWPFGRKKR